jgi:hypothetical protein
VTFAGVSAAGVLLSGSVSDFGVGMLFRVLLEIVQQCCVLFPASLDSR